jgi:hypothetical protein
MIRPSQFSALLNFALGQPVLVWAGLPWEIQQIERTALPGEQAIVAEFPFENTGATIITIREIRTGCECTVVNWPKRSYAPGEAGELKTAFTVGNWKGPHERPMTTFTDAASAPAPTLAFSVEIPETLTDSARMLLWKVDGGAVEQFVDVRTAEKRIRSFSMEELKPTAPLVPIDALETAEEYRLHIQPGS